MATTSSRHLARLSVLVALIGVAVSGCGGGARTVGTTPSTATTTATATNGLEHKSAAEVEAAAAAALKAARSVHVTGTGHSDGRPVQVDLRFQGTSSTGTIQMDGATLQITTIGTDTYIKADQRAWQVLGAPTRTSTRSRRSGWTSSGTCAGCRTSAATSPPQCRAGCRSWSASTAYASPTRSCR